MKEARAFQRAFTLRVLELRADQYEEEIREDPEAFADRFVDYQGDAEGFADALTEEIDVDAIGEELFKELFPDAELVGSIIDRDLLLRGAKPLAEKLNARAGRKAAELYPEDDDEETDD